MTNALDLTDLTPDAAAALVASEVGADWTRRFVDELGRRVRSEPLERIVELWGLSNAAAARMFGVSRQAFTKWLNAGPPSTRAAAVADLASATAILDRYVKRERIPAVVRRRAPALGGESLLALAESGNTRTVLERTRAMFDLRRVQP
jgi:hypothetical protein